jgi:hypothetical protein
MPDMITPVGALVQPPNPNQTMGLLSNIIGLRQQQQTLQQQQLQTAQAQGVQRFYNAWDPSKHVADDGTTDVESAIQSNEFQNAGNAKPAIMESLLNIKKGQLANIQSLTTLNSNLVSRYDSGVGAFVNDPDVIADKIDPKTGVNPGRAKINQFNSQFSQESPAAARIVGIYGKVAQTAAPGNLAAALRAIQMQAQEAGGQQAQQNPVQESVAGTNSQGGLTSNIYNVNRATGLQPEQQPVMTTSAGLPTQTVTNPTTGGAAVVGGRQGTIPAPIGGGGGGPIGASASGGWQPVAGQPTVQAQIEAARTAGDQVPVKRDINNKILRLAGQATFGKGTDFLHQVAATMGLPSGSAYQEEGAFLDRQAALASQSMGLPNTNAGLAASEKFTGNTQYNNQVIKDKTLFADSLQSAAAAYRAGLDRVVGTGATPDYGAYQQYRSTWMQNFDPQVFAYENAFNRGDKDELTKIEGDEGRKGMAQLLQKRRVLMGLVNGQ